VNWFGESVPNVRWEHSCTVCWGLCTKKHTKKPRKGRTRKMIEGLKDIKELRRTERRRKREGQSARVSEWNIDGGGQCVWGSERCSVTVDNHSLIYLSKTLSSHTAPAKQFLLSFPPSSFSLSLPPITS